MGKGRNWMERLADSTDLSGEPMSLQPLVEIAGEHRVLIEHHRGVLHYSREKVSVKVRFGAVEICGSCLELCHMSRVQLIVAGKIDQILLIRR